MTARPHNLELPLRRVLCGVSWLSTALAVLFCTCHGSAALAHPPIAAVTSAPDDDDEDQPLELPAGLTAEYKGADGRAIVRIDPALSFSWNEVPADPRLTPGNLSAHWTGKLLVIAPGPHAFHLYAAGGTVRLLIDGQTLIDSSADQAQWLDSQPIELEYGHHAITVEFRRTAPAAHLGLYWSGPRFQREHVPERALFHEATPASDARFEQGRQLVRGLRCAACHELPDALPVAKAPSLAKLDGNISRAWLMDWIGGHKEVPGATVSPRVEKGDNDSPESHPAIDDVKFRMPGLGLSRDDARHIVAYLLDEAQRAGGKTKPTGHDAADGAATDKPPSGDLDAGSELFYSLGCLACHSIAGLGSHRLSGGGDLSNVGDKRPANFFVRWLATPADSNPAHRMPIFPLSDEEPLDLATFLAAQQATPCAKPVTGDTDDFGGLPQRGRELVAQHHCGACHDLPTINGAEPPLSATIARRRLPADPDWQKSCLGEPNPRQARPGYRLRSEQRDAIVEYVRQLRGVTSQLTSRADGARLLAELNCLGCHSRGLSAGIAASAPALVAAHPELSASLAALAPPALTDVGDKLERPALLDAMATAASPRRPWLKIRMPRFKFAPGEADALADWLIATDRIPERLPDAQAVTPARLVGDDLLMAAGRRLVTSDGFGCASCHQIGKSIPKQDNLAARGSDLSVTGERIRRAWFDRWVRNPARIVPRMEMPALEIPVPGVLHERLDDQIAAVWHVLNRPGFTPPTGSAVRVVRTRNMPNEPERAALLSDVIRVDGRAFLRPLVIGLSNRHTALIDFEENRLAAWWIGDTARERTEGKRWFWEPGGTQLLTNEIRGSSELSLLRNDAAVEPTVQGQCAAELDSWQHVDGGVTFAYRLTFAGSEKQPAIELKVRQTITAIATDTEGGHAGFRRRLEIEGAPAASEFSWRLLPEGIAGSIDKSHFTSTGGSAGEVSLQVTEPADASLVSNASPTVRLSAQNGAPHVVCTVDYTSAVAADRFAAVTPAPLPRPAATLHCVPGFDGVRLPLPPTEMPTGLAWRRDGTLIFSSLKGEVWSANDADGDGLADTLQALGDDLAAPYGLCEHRDSIDVINKNGLLRLSDFDDAGRARRTEVVANGWGHTDDYHDWAVGLIPDGSAGYYVALPCRQDKRSDAAARLRGWAVHLVPREATIDDPRRYDVAPFCAGVRFPMGLARNSADALFATDNQGNYNPFNELNHLVADAHYGFFSKHETPQGTPPPRRDPAIEIPHPWTRSVNGICFLETPADLRTSRGASAFGPWEGHLVGCEYDTRRLVRMSLERVGDTYQGTVYPLSIEPAEGEEPLEGPVICQVGPDGALYVGNIRDSGWGAGQNTGSIVRLTANGKWPQGIATINAAFDGFVMHFTEELPRAAAANPANYAIESFRRIPTSDYGGPDVDRQTERIRLIRVADDLRSVHVTLEKIRAGFVYEFHVKNLGRRGEIFHPAEAYYTLRAVPAE